MTWKAIDDSEGLSHYGVLGMKWGVRNAETERKYGGFHKQANKSVQRFQKKANRAKRRAEAYEKSARQTKANRAKRRAEAYEKSARQMKDAKTFAKDVASGRTTKLKGRRAKDARNLFVAQRYYGTHLNKSLAAASAGLAVVGAMSLASAPVQAMAIAGGTAIVAADALRYGGLASDIYKSQKALQKEDRSIKK